MYRVRTDAHPVTCGTVVKPHNRKRNVVLLRGGFSYEVTVRYAPQKWRWTVYTVYYKGGGRTARAPRCLGLRGFSHSRCCCRSSLGEVQRRLFIGARRRKHDGRVRSSLYSKPKRARFAELTVLSPPNRKVSQGFESGLQRSLGLTHGRGRCQRFGLPRIFG